MLLAFVSKLPQGFIHTNNKEQTLIIYKTVHLRISEAYCFTKSCLNFIEFRWHLYNNVSEYEWIKNVTEINFSVLWGILLPISGFVLFEKFHRNSPKFAIFYTQRSKVAFSAFHFVLLYFFPNVNIDQGIH